MSADNEHKAAAGAAIARARTVAYWVLALAIVTAVAILTTTAERRASLATDVVELRTLAGIVNHAENTVREIRRVMQFQALGRADEAQAITQTIEAVDETARLSAEVRRRLGLPEAREQIPVEIRHAINRRIMEVEDIIVRDRSSPLIDRAPEAVVAEAWLEAMRLRDIVVLSAHVSSDAVRLRPAFSRFLDATGERVTPEFALALRKQLDTLRTEAEASDLARASVHGQQLDDAITARSTDRSPFVVGGYGSTFRETLTAAREADARVRNLTTALSGDLAIEVPGQNVALPVGVIAILFPAVIAIGHAACVIALFHGGRHLDRIGAPFVRAATVAGGAEFAPLPARPVLIVLSILFLAVVFLLPDVLAFLVIRDLASLIGDAASRVAYATLVIAVLFSGGAIFAVYYKLTSAPRG